MSNTQTLKKEKKNVCNTHLFMLYEYKIINKHDSFANWEWKRKCHKIACIPTRARLADWLPDYSNMRVYHQQCVLSSFLVCIVKIRRNRSVMLSIYDYLMNASPRFRINMEDFLILLLTFFNHHLNRI